MQPTKLLLLAATLWSTIGALLLVRGVGMLLTASDRGASLSTLLLASGLGLALGGAKGRFVLSKAALRNKARILALERPRPWDVFRPGFYPLIALMIALGAGLRAAARAGWLGGYPVVGAIYVGIGAALLASSLAYARPLPAPVLTRSDEPPRRRRPRIGVLVVNLGTPDAPEPGAVRRYLREFLGDPRVVEVPRAIWFVILNGIVLPLRSRRSAEAYRRVWTEDGSPLLHHTARAVEALAAELGEDYRVVLGMRYGKPSLLRALEELRLEPDLEEVRVLPLFPQYSNTTTGTAQARVAELVSAWRDMPALSFLPAYPEDPGYVDALARRIEEARGEEPVDLHVFSFHGLPAEYVRRGDPYLEQCTRTSWALARRLGLRREEWEMVFQSRFGREPWLEPYLDEFAPRLAREGARRILVALPGFAADCLETLEEVGMELCAEVEEAGAELVVVPALNQHPAWIRAMARLVRREAGEGPDPARPLPGAATGVLA